MEENKNEEKIEEVVNEPSQIGNPTVEENKKCKSNKPFVIIIVVIAMALTFGCGIMLGKKLFENKKSNNKKETEVVDNNQNESTNKDQNKEEIDNNVDDDINTSLGEQLINTLLRYYSLDSKEYIYEQMIYYANNKTVEASNLNHELVYQVILNKYYTNKNTFPNEIKLDEFNEHVLEVFDSSYKYVAKDYYDRCSGQGYKLDGDKYVLVPSQGGCGGTAANLAPYKIVDSHLTNDNLIVKVKVLFGKYIDVNGERIVEYYEDFDKTKIINGANQENYENYIDKGSIYLFTFKNKNGNYVFVKSELE
jgi:hypothetical protein